MLRTGSNQFYKFISCRPNRPMRLRTLNPTPKPSNICKEKYFRSYHATISAKAPIQVDMPALSPTMEEGTIVSWVVEEGSEISTGDALCEVETDKAVVMMEAVEDGTLAKILLPAGTKGVKIGTPIAIIAEEDEDVVTAAAMKVSSNADASNSSSENALFGLNTLAESNVSLPSNVKVNKRISPAVRQLFHQYSIDQNKIQPTGPHNMVLKGDVLSYIAKNGLKPVKQKSDRVDSQPVKETKEKTVDKEVLPEKPAKIMDSSVNSEDHELSGMRKVIAKRLTESKQSIPHTYASIDCIMNNVLSLRKNLAKGDIKVSVNDFIIKAAAKSLQNFPEVNSTWDKEEINHCKTVDVSIAVATDTGLITPIVKNADNKGLAAITTEVKELAKRARSGKLKPEEFQGGSFTISNLGMYGIKEFTAVINPPQVCIMAVGGSRVVPIRDSKTNEIKPQTMMTVTMSSDARAVDVVMAENFLTQFKTNIENPLLMI